MSDLFVKYVDPTPNENQNCVLISKLLEAESISKAICSIIMNSALLTSTLSQISGFFSAPTSSSFKVLKNWYKNMVWAVVASKMGIGNNVSFSLVYQVRPLIIHRSTSQSLKKQAKYRGFLHEYLKRGQRSIKNETIG